MSSDNKKHLCRTCWTDEDPGHQYGIYGRCREFKNGFFSFLISHWEGESMYVNYCPFCGTKAPRQIRRKDWEKIS